MRCFSKKTFFTLDESGEYDLLRYFWDPLYYFVLHVSIGVSVIDEGDSTWR